LISIETDKEGNEITLQDILGTEPDEVVDKVELMKIEESNLDVQDDREQEVIRGRFGLDGGDEAVSRILQGEEVEQKRVLAPRGLFRVFIDTLTNAILISIQAFPPRPVLPQAASKSRSLHPV